MSTVLNNTTTGSRPDKAARRVNRLAGSVDWSLILGCAAAAALLSAVAKPVAAAWLGEYLAPESYYQHGPIIPSLVGLMFWKDRARLRAVSIAPSPAALLLLTPALALYVFASRNFALSLVSAAFLMIIWSSVWLILGARFVRAAAFPLAFLAAMAPLPGPILNDATLRLQMLSTSLANGLLHLLSFPTTLSGNLITMDHFSLSVDVPCSGLKLLISLMTVCAALAYLMDGAPLRRFALFIVSVPLAVVVNTVRIALIGVVGECVGDNAAHAFHDWSGVLTLVFGVSCVLGLARALGCRKFAGWSLF
jgi:exosortase